MFCFDEFITNGTPPTFKIPIGKGGQCRYIYVCFCKNISKRSFSVSDSGGYTATG